MIVQRISLSSRTQKASTSHSRSTRLSSRTTRPTRTATSSTSTLTTRRNSIHTSRLQRQRDILFSCSMASLTLLLSICSSRSSRSLASHVLMVILSTASSLRTRLRRLSSLRKRLQTSLRCSSHRCQQSTRPTSWYRFRHSEQRLPL